MAKPDGRRRLSLATQVLIGFVVGVASGVFFGDLIAPLGIVGDAFIGLLQMTVSAVRLCFTDLGTRSIEFWRRGDFAPARRNLVGDPVVGCTELSS